MAFWDPPSVNDLPTPLPAPPAPGSSGAGGRPWAAGGGGGTTAPPPPSMLPPPPLEEAPGWSPRGCAVAEDADALPSSSQLLGGAALDLPLVAPPLAAAQDAAGAPPSPRADAATAAAVAAAAAGAAAIHPQKWSEEQVRAWWQRRTRRRKDIGVPSRGTDGRNIMRWPVSRFEQLCNGNSGLAVSLYQDLRNEIDRFEHAKRAERQALGGGHDDFVISSPRSEKTRNQSRRCRSTPEDHGGCAGTGAQQRLLLQQQQHQNQQQRPRTAPGQLLQPPPPMSCGDLTDEVRKVSSRDDVGVGVGASPGRRGPTGGGGGGGGGGSSCHGGGGGGAAHPEIGLAACHRAAATPARAWAARALAGGQANQTSKFAPPPRQRSAQLSPETEQRCRQQQGAGAAVGAATGRGGAPKDARKARVKSAPRAARTPTAVQRGSAALAPAIHNGGGCPCADTGSAVSWGGAGTDAQQRPLGDAAAPPSPSPRRSRSGGGAAAQLRGQRSLVMEDGCTISAAQSSRGASPRPGSPRPSASRRSPPLPEDDSGLALGVRGGGGGGGGCGGGGGAGGVGGGGGPGGGGPGTAAAAGRVEEEDGTTRRMFDKRLLRRRHHALFDQQLAIWRSQHVQGENATASSEVAPSRVRVCVRKRPLFDYEREAEEFDVISVRNSDVVVHNCLTKADLKSLFISHMGFPFSHAIGEDATDDDVYHQCVAHAVQHVLCDGVATIFMFGQTGSGKTHTMSGIIGRAISDMFDDRSVRDCQPSYNVTAFEIAGKTMRDLLDGAAKELKVMEDRNHRTHVLGVREKEAQNAKELISVLKEAQTHRTTRATQVNDTSSRSHAVYRIAATASVGQRGGSARAGPAGGGSGAAAASVLTLVDCAGSERREDSSHHDSQSRKDAAEINSTIFALKECFRVMRASRGQQQPPYRDSLLTRVLADSFASEQALIVAIGTVSPSATDTEHSIGTLRALQQLQGTEMAFQVKEDVAMPRAHDEASHPRHWSEEEVRQWAEVALGGRVRVFAPALTRGTDGKNLVRWPVARFTQLCGGDDDLGTRLYQDLRLRIRGGTAASGA